VASKRESPLSLHFRLFEETHVPDIVMTSGQEAARLTTKEGVIVKLKVMSKTLEETIKSNTERKISVDNLIKALTTQKEDGDMVEGNEDADCNDAAGSSNASGGNDEETDGSEDI